VMILDLRSNSDHNSKIITGVNLSRR